MQAQKQVESLKNTGKWSKIPADEVIKRTIKALSDNNFSAEIVESADEAKERVLSLIPLGAEVMVMTSKTLDTIGITKEINESGKYDSVKEKLKKMDRNTQEVEMLKMGAAAEYAVGSVHAVSQDGHVLIASNSGSQLPGYVYGSANVIWVIGAQKIVKNVHEGFERINERALPMEAMRAHEAYGAEGSNISKLLIMNREPKPNRIKVLLVKEVFGF